MSSFPGDSLLSKKVEKHWQKFDSPRLQICKEELAHYLFHIQRLGCELHKAHLFFLLSLCSVGGLMVFNSKLSHPFLQTALCAKTKVRIFAHIAEHQK